MALLINIINMQRDGDTSNRTVFLGDLPFQGAVDDFQEIKKTVREAFNAQDVEDVKIKDRKVNEGVSFIFAFVSFKTEEAADRAIAAKTVKIGSKEVKVERYIPERDYQLYIKGVSNLEQKDIEEFFGKAGKVSAVQFYVNEGTTTALVKFTNPADSEKFLTQPDQEINGVSVRIEKYIPKDKREENHRQLFLKKIPIIGDKAKLEADLLKQFERFGDITKKITVDSKEGMKVGSAVVHYANEKSMEEAREKFNLKLFGEEHPMELDVFLTKKDREQKGIIFITNIKPDADIQALVKIFAEFGKIQGQSFNKTVTRAEEGPIQKGTITYETKEGMCEALAEWSKVQSIYAFFVSGKPKINIYQDKNERSDFLRNQKPISKPVTLTHPMGFPPGSRPPFGMMPMGMMGIPMGMGMPMVGMHSPVMGMGNMMSGPMGNMMGNSMGNPMGNMMGGPMGNIGGNPSGNFNQAPRNVQRTGTN